MCNMEFVVLICCCLALFVTNVASIARNDSDSIQNILEREDENEDKPRSSVKNWFNSLILPTNSQTSKKTLPYSNRMPYSNSTATHSYGPYHNAHQYIVPVPAMYPYPVPYHSMPGYMSPYSMSNHFQPSPVPVMPFAMQPYPLISQMHNYAIKPPSVYSANPSSISYPNSYLSSASTSYSQIKNPIAYVVPIVSYPYNRLISNRPSGLNPSLDKYPNEEKQHLATHQSDNHKDERQEGVEESQNYDNIVPYINSMEQFSEEEEVPIDDYQQNPNVNNNHNNYTFN